MNGNAFRFTRSIAVTAIIGFGVVAFGGNADAAVTKTKYDSYTRQTVVAKGVKYDVEIVKIDLANPKLTVKTITGTNGDSCYNKSCPTRSLKSYVDEGKGFAAINGAYFCPSDYSQCKGAPGNYYWMVYNFRTKKLVNTLQNRYNSGPLFTFDANRQWHFFRVTKTFPGTDLLELVDEAKLTGAISNGPAFIDQGQYILSAADIAAMDNKSRNVKSNRSGLGMKGSTVYLIVARKATVPDLGQIMKSLKLDFALNLDGGGSTALWYRDGYKVGPGRNLPNAVVFSEK